MQTKTKPSSIVPAMVAALALCMSGSVDAAAQDAAGKRLAIVIAHEAGLSFIDAYRARNSARMVAGRLKSLGFQLIRPTAGGACTNPGDDALPIGASQVQAALQCVDADAKAADLVVFYYAGAVSARDTTTYILPPADNADGAQSSKIAVDTVLQAAAATATFASLVLIDTIEAASTANADAAPVQAVRVGTLGLRRILAFSAPLGERVEAPGLLTTAYSRRLAATMDVEISAQQEGKPLRDLREIMTSAEVATAREWPSRTRELLIEGLGAQPVTFAGQSAASASAPGGDKPDCNSMYRAAVDGGSCQQLLQLDQVCRTHPHAPVVATGLKLRCADEVVASKQQALQQTFAKIELEKSCAVWSGFVERHGTDFDLADAPEIEKANALKTRYCAEEARTKEIAMLEGSLRSVLFDNDCKALERFKKEGGSRLSPDQSDRLDKATKTRCESEVKAQATLRQCIEQADKSGNFCGAPACFREYRNVLPKDVDFAAYGAENSRRIQICREHSTAQTCFAADECGAERCSLPLRLAVANGPLIGHIQRLEQDMRGRCEVKLTRERVAAAEVQQALERQRQAQQALERQRQAALDSAARRNSTFRLTLCNNSSESKIYVSVSYYDFDASDWIVEGWWSVDRGDCDYIGDRFRRGYVYFYAHTAQERYVWKGDHGLCVTWGRYRRVNSSSYTCGSDRHRKFRTAQVTQDEYSANFND